MTTDIESNLKQARIHLENNEPQRAHDLLIDALKIKPDSRPALLMLGGHYFSTGKLQEAEMIFEQLILLEPTVGQYSIALFNTLWKQQRFDDAFEEIRRFISIADKETEKDTLDQYIEITRKLSQPKTQ